jgi:hypothetical protein
MLPVLFSVLAWSQEYTLTDLGTLGGSSSGAIAVNNAGQVAGAAAIAGDGHSDPFLYSGGKMTDVWTGGTEFGGTAVAINNSGHIVVNYNLDAQGDTESFIDFGTVWGDVGIGGAVDMNDSDTVVGNGPKGYWVYSNYELNAAPGYKHPGSGAVTAYAINNSGQIVGECLHADPYYTGNNGMNGCVFGPDGSTVLLDADLGPAAPFPPYAIAYNGATCGSNGVSQFATWSNHGTQTYAVSLEGYAACAALDDYGTAVGWGEAPTWIYRIDGYIYDPVNQLRDLNALVSHISRKGQAVINIHDAAAISDTGYIAANCGYNVTEPGAIYHACLLTPNWAAILRDSIVALAKGDPGCVQCKAELEPEAESLPSNFADLSKAEWRKAKVTVEKIESQLAALGGGGRINERAYLLLAHDAEMAFQALGRPER